MRNIFFSLLILFAFQPSMAASFPAQNISLPIYETASNPISTSNKKEGGKLKKATKVTFLQKAKLKLLQYCQSKGLLVDGEMTVKQKRQAKWSLILGLGSIVLLLIPYVGLLAIPAAITGLILGIKSVKGNSNTNGIIGIIASGLTLLLFVAALVVIAAFFASWN